jgi:hypothetical protein
MADTLENPYPEEYGFYRIGTPINLDTQKAAPDFPAFEMELLQGARCLDMSLNPTSSRRIQAGGSDIKSQDASGFSIDTACNVSTPWVDAALSFHMAKSENVATSGSSQTITAIARQESSIRLRMNAPSSLLLRCATDDFRAKVQAIREALQRRTSGDAGATSALADAVEAFYRRYGTGFVSKLVLGAIGVFKGTAVYSARAEETKKTFGGSASVSGCWGGVSAAAEYAKEHIGSNASGTFVAQSFAMPPGSEPARWVEGLLDTFEGMQLSQLSNLQAWKEPFDKPVASAKPPEIKARPPKDPLPEFSGGEIDDQLKNMELREREKAWSKDHPGTKPSAAEYRAWAQEIDEKAQQLKKAARDADDDAVVQLPDEARPAEEPAVAPGGAPALRSFLAAPGAAAGLRSARLAAATLVAPGGEPAGALAAGGGGAPGPQRARDLAAWPLAVADAPRRTGGVHPRSELLTLLAAPASPPPAEAEPPTSPAPAEEPAITSSDVHFGDYGVVGFEYTPWGEVFPELRNLGKGLTRARLTLRLAMAWVSTRHLLAQYLRFCARHFPEVSPEGLSAAATAFQGAIGDVTEELLAATRQNLPIASPRELERSFLARLERRRFDLQRHYEFLKDIYPWLKLIPFGVIPVYTANGSHRAQQYGSSDALALRIKEPGEPQFGAATLLERGALRLYPVLASSRAGEPRVFWTSREFPDASTVIGSSLCAPPARIDPDLPTWKAAGKISPGELLKRAHDWCESLHTELPQVQPAPEPGRLWTIGPNPVKGALEGGVPQVGLFSGCRGGKPVQLVQSIGVLVPGKEREQLKDLLQQLQSLAWRLEELHRVSFVPVDYTDARNAGDTFPGGGAMWFESRTDAILEAIRMLGQ